VELIDDIVIGLARENVEYRRYVDLLPSASAGTPGAVLYVEYFADSATQLADRFADLQSRFPELAIVRYTDPGSMSQAWKLRKAGEPLLHGLHGARKPLTFIEDLAVHPDRLAAFVCDIRALIARHGTTAAYYAHASVGCLHIRPMLSLRDEGDRHAMQRIAEEATDLVMEYGGALSGEHGDGRVRSHLLERFYGRGICDAFRAIKAVFDPENRLNPGNIVSSVPMLDGLRVKPAERFIDVPRIKTFFSYQREHGFGEAVEMCNGAGVCRRMKGGTMCPSYRATLDERHATRGRGNALRLAITGQFSDDGRAPLWNDPETLQTLDLCLSCKACKSECPSNVDVAKLKAEYLAQGYASGAPAPLASRLFGHVRLINRLGSALHPIANAMNRLGAAKLVARWLTNLHPERELPAFGRSLYRWMRVRPAVNPGAPAIVLLPDCFTVYNEPKIGRAAISTLEALGYRVVLPRLGCCGRAMISNGLLEQAVTSATRTAKALMDCVRRESAVAVVSCEPSCISAIKDEWLDLDLGLEPAPLNVLARRTFLVEEFVEAFWTSHPRDPLWRADQAGIPIPGPPTRVLLHGHCHQKALWGVETSAKILRRMLGEQLAVLDSGCCGMAGSFGYTRDHYDLSMRIGEMSLFSALRAAPDDIIVAPGTSCRQQIHDGLGRRAMHPIELIAKIVGVRSSEADSRRADRA
jgi:Fe-S oxidoreductase